MHTLHGAFTDLVNATQQYNDDDSEVVSSVTTNNPDKPGGCPGSPSAGGVSAGGPHKHVLFMGMSGLKPETAATSAQAPLTSTMSGFFHHLSHKVSLKSEKTDAETKEEELADIRKRKTFWQSAAKLSANAGGEIYCV
jgi:hypothetical protein